MKRIAVVEDNPDNRLLVQVILEPYYKVVEYESGYAALEGFRTEKPDLVLLDVSLPGLDGPEVLRRIRADASLQHLPVIALTAHAMAGDRQRFVNSGFDDYVSKPIVDESILLEAIRRVLSSAQQATATPPGETPSSQQTACSAPTRPAAVPGAGHTEVAGTGDEGAVLPHPQEPGATASPLDPAALDRLCRLGGSQFAIDMLDLFLSYGAEKLSEARTAWKSGNHELVADAVHPIKSSAGNIGAVRIQSLCAAIEQGVTEQPPSQTERQLSDLAQAFAEARPHLEREKARLAEGKP